jgi:hypothetical protein
MLRQSVLCLLGAMLMVGQGCPVVPGHLVGAVHVGAPAYYASPVGYDEYVEAGYDGGYADYGYSDEGYYDGGYTDGEEGYEDAGDGEDDANYDDGYGDEDEYWYGDEGEEYEDPYPYF